jgi:hypothetical protein
MILRTAILTVRRPRRLVFSSSAPTWKTGPAPTLDWHLAILMSSIRKSPANWTASRPLVPDSSRLAHSSRQPPRLISTSRTGTERTSMATTST